MASSTVGFIHQTLDNRYFINHKIAEGGMASVYEATDQRLNKRVAIKIMHTSLAFSRNSEQYIERFHREALSAASLDNPHIVHVYDAGDIDAIGYIVMEYVDGTNLRSVMNEKKYFSVNDTIRIISQILDGLADAHDHNIIHRDIKPENIMINTRGEVQIADFGLAKHTDNATVAPTGMFMGTTTYIAPETASDNTSLPASDLYSVGLIAWEMLMGRPPFASDNPVAEVFKHVNEDVPTLRSVTSIFPQQLSDFISELTQRNYSKRPSTARIALDNLTRISNSLSDAQKSITLDDTHLPASRMVRSSSHTYKDGNVPPPPISTHTTAKSPILRWFKNHQLTALVTAVIAVILVIAGGVAWWNSFGPGSYYELPQAHDVTCTESTPCTVTNADAAAYQKQLADADIPFTTQVSYSDTVKKGKIISTTPSVVGSHISKSNGSVSIIISSGIEKIRIPSDILDSSTNNGKQPLKALKNAGFINVKHSADNDQYSLTVPQGSAISINPKPGTRVNHNAEITVILSQGLKPVTMPDVTGLSRADALSSLNELNLKVTVREEYSSSVDAGKVISQSEEDGTKLHWNDKVLITISKGARSVTIPDVRGMTLSRARTTLEDLGLKVSVTERGGDTVDKQSLSPGEIISVIDEKGNHTRITLTTTKR
ncbi:serine/threonine-protein kinase [Alloscardovia theropitheci]|uniref:non-specific serine/threonine protein kinase n=1 Tax=Alloscardovia theropitheci TaxID=2496842 RepID=A0A4R0QTI3_9BIFI|nr:PASTA domain-containing protein [Alloscardovia theropitheci]TCD54838.1 serine/threonine-protein kinase [Alloscardovia theropitheci]